MSPLEPPFAGRSSEPPTDSATAWDSPNIEQSDGGGNALHPTSHEPETSGQRRGKFSISLGTLLLSIALLAALLGQWATVRRLGAVRAERDALRREVGYLAVEDPTLVAAVRVAISDPLVWQYRIQTPQDRPYRFCYGTRWPQGSPRPRWIAAQSVPAGHSTLIMRVMRDPRDDLWKIVTVLRHEGTTLRQSTPLTTAQTALFRSSTDTIRGGAGQDTISAPAGQRLMVADQRWASAESGMLLFGQQAPDEDIDGIFGELQPDRGPLN